MYICSYLYLYVHTQAAMDLFCLYWKLMTPMKAVPPPPEYPPMPPTYTYPTTATMISEMNAYGRLEEGWHGNDDNVSHNVHDDGDDRDEELPMSPASIHIGNNTDKLDEAHPSLVERQKHYRQ